MYLSLTTRMAKDGKNLYSTISCKSCQTRKVKCDRYLPQCATCIKSSQSCSYAPTRLKPGPKIGASQRIAKRAATCSCSKDAAAGDSVQIRRNAPKTVALPNMAQDDWQEVSMDEDTSQTPEPRILLQHLSKMTASHDPTGRLKPDSMTAQDLSLLIHPSHETATFSTEKDNGQPPPQALLSNRNEKQCLVTDACRILNVSAEDAQKLINLFHDNMNSFTLFHRPSFEDKIRAIGSITQLCALLSAIFSFSARFDQWEGNNLRMCPNLSIQGLSELTIDFSEKALKECSDDPPPLCLLQAMIINTFQLLIKGVRGEAWRSLGTCIRLAYELRLHLVDTREVNSTSEAGIANWSADEERRRAWWAIWELDTFASTVKQCPTGIDWSHNQTFLPIRDEMWFSQKYQRSCYLAKKPNDRWKMLQESGNESPKAWYIVVNSLMRDSQTLPSQDLDLAVPLALNLPSSTANCGRASSDKTEISEKLAIMSHAIHCFKITVPRYLQYHGEYLSFTSHDLKEAVAARKLHSMIYIIYVMEQLAKFMIYHQQAFAGMCRQSNHEGIYDNLLVESNSPQTKAKLKHSAKGLVNNALNSYLQAADNILTIINRSAENHVHHLNPLLASTIWLAAAVQLVYKVFGPPEVNRDLAESKFDVLRLHHRMYVEFWDTPQVLQDTLETLEEQLHKLRTPLHHENARTHIKGSATASNSQVELSQLESELVASNLRQKAGAKPKGSTNYQTKIDDALTSNMTSFPTASETRAAVGQARLQQSQLAIGTRNPSMEDNFDGSSSAMPIDSDSFEELDYQLGWDFGFNDNIPFYLDGLLSGKIC